MNKKQTRITFLTGRGTEDELTPKMLDVVNTLRKYPEFKIDISGTNNINLVTKSKIFVVTNALVNNGVLFCRLIKERISSSIILVISDGENKMMDNLILKYYELGNIDFYLDQQGSVEYIANTIECIANTNFQKVFPTISGKEYSYYEINEYVKSTKNALSENDVRTIASKILKKIGAQVNIKGFRYAIEAIVILVEKGLNVGMTKELYPSVAAHYNKTVDEGSQTATTSRVERAIRLLIENIWDRTSDIDTLTELGLWSASKGKPTNSEFLMSIADSITSGAYQKFLNL